MEKKEIREWFLKKLYDEGYRYIIKDGDAIYPTEKRGSSAVLFGANVNAFKELFSDELQKLGKKEGMVVDICNALDMVDWVKVRKDTKVLVSDDRCNWERRYFVMYEAGENMPFTVFANGGDSWSTEDWELYKYCKLAEE